MTGAAGADDASLRVGISSCLLGEAVRFDGGHKHDRFLTDTLGPHLTWVPVCPEVELGLGVPREAIRLVAAPAGSDEPSPRLVSRSGLDHTAGMRAVAGRLADQLVSADIHGFVCKKGSPSCGLERVRVHPPEGDGPPTVDGRGLFAQALVERLPMLPIEEEGRLNDPALRENFIERLFTHRAWRDLLASSPRPADLVAFHTAHKSTLLAHHEAGYRALGPLVAQAGATDDFAGLLDEYGRGFAATMAHLATRGTHTNVLSHLQGFVSDHLDAGDRQELTEEIERYRRGEVPLVVPLTLLRHHVRRHPHPWVSTQTYLTPYPSELMLRNHV